jgi:hypothetical protein
VLATRQFLLFWQKWFQSGSDRFSDFQFALTLFGVLSAHAVSAIYVCLRKVRVNEFCLPSALLRCWYWVRVKRVRFTFSTAALLVQGSSERVRFTFSTAALLVHGHSERIARDLFIDVCMKIVLIICLSFAKWQFDFHLLKCGKFSFSRRMCFANWCISFSRFLALRVSAIAEKSAKISLLLLFISVRAAFCICLLFVLFADVNGFFVGINHYTPTVWVFVRSSTCARRDLWKD